MKKVWIMVMAAVLLLSGCGKKADTDQTVTCMGTQMQLQFWGKDSQTASQQVQDLLTELEKEWSWSSEESVIAYMELYGLVSEDILHEEVTVDGEVIEVPQSGAAYAFTPRQQEVAQKALAVSTRTNGAYDPQLHDLITLWGFTDGAQSAPTREAAADAAQLSNWELDSAIKGYAGTQAVKCLQELKVESALLNMGSVIQTYSTESEDKVWRIDVPDPENTNATACTLEVGGTTAVATTGVNQRCFDQNGQTYHDVLDPVTGYPVDNGIASVTVICADGMTADCLSYGLFVMGYEAAVKHWQESDDFEMVIVMEDGKVHATEGVKLHKSSAETIRR
ncbi:MAG: FAD:protein FMN transferase [Oscillospiraceae bacterium]|nr:FAD:protein FMN transferase [Oscillospiraceae bacterium]